MTREEKAQFCIDNQKCSPAFQFYPTDWFGSRHVAAMNSSQRGIHCSLIFAAWLEPSCGFPAGEEWLTARVLENETPDCEIVLKWCWFKYKDIWFNERLLNERIKQIELSFKRIASGSTGGRPVKSKINNNKPFGIHLDSKSKAKETKSEEEEEEEKEEGKEIVIVPEYRSCSDLLKKRILERRSPKIDELRLIKWDKEVRLMVIRDKRNLEDIKQIINDCHDMEPTDKGFSWRDNILSMSKLREQWNSGKIYVGVGKGKIQTKTYGRQELTPESFKKQMEYVFKDELNG